MEEAVIAQKLVELIQPKYVFDVINNHEWFQPHSALSAKNMVLGCGLIMTTSRYTHTFAHTPITHAHGHMHAHAQEHTDQ